MLMTVGMLSCSLLLVGLSVSVWLIDLPMTWLLIVLVRVRNFRPQEYLRILNREISLSLKLIKDLLERLSNPRVKKSSLIWRNLLKKSLFVWRVNSRLLESPKLVIMKLLKKWLPNGKRRVNLFKRKNLFQMSLNLPLVLEESYIVFWSKASELERTTNKEHSLSSMIKWLHIKLPFCHWSEKMSWQVLLKTSSLS